MIESDLWFTCLYLRGKAYVFHSRLCFLYSSSESFGNPSPPLLTEHSLRTNESAQILDKFIRHGRWAAHIADCVLGRYGRAGTIGGGGGAKIIFCNASGVDADIPIFVSIL
jgi:hypothetical protein